MRCEDLVLEVGMIDCRCRLNAVSQRLDPSLCRCSSA